MKYKTAIAGMGMVGGALSKVLKDPTLYDPPKGIGTEEELNKANVIFICVPTKYDNGCDISLIEDVVKKLEDNKVVVIKSTVLPGTTDYFQNKYPQHGFLFNPEFLTEATADQDMKYPDRQIVGYTDKSYTVAEDIMLMLPLAPFERIVLASEAEMAKYYNNAWFATKVIFANQMYDICQKIGIDYDRVKDMAAADKRIGRSHLDVWHKGSRGFGGKCLRKDLDALLKFAEDNEINIPLLKEVKNINEKLNPNK